MRALAAVLMVASLAAGTWAALETRAALIGAAELMEAATRRPL